MDASDATSSTRNAASPTPPEFDGAVAWAAWLYYVDQLNQSEVAKAMNVSRASVVNYLQEARETGLVSVQIDQEAFARTLESRALIERYGLASAAVIPDLNRGDTDQRIGEAAGRLLASMIETDDTIGVAWGKTVLAAARSISGPRRARNLSVVQLCGSSIGTSDFSPEFCTSLMANRLGARCINLLAPAIVSSERLHDELMREPMLVNQFRMIHAAGKVIFGVGDVGPESTYARSGISDEAGLAGMIGQGAVGVIIGRLIDAEGRSLPSPLEGRTIGITLDELKAMPVRICAAGGPQKIEAIRAGLRGGYATHLVTDMATARALLE
ncbi:sugar-binding transcriptional regulator [Aquamicrobium soli]|jgi:DNA-binding transcriptional regulator LsrR (DeoR family)|uniref:Sugar-binding transcriptional regulator n=1 Tax=Aquamicrobium soli TaxID=1811518 RepID=A0ABV7K9D7_9HYPH